MASAAVNKGERIKQAMAMSWSASILGLRTDGRFLCQWCLFVPSLVDEKGSPYNLKLLDDCKEELIVGSRRGFESLSAGNR